MPQPTLNDQELRCLIAVSMAIAEKHKPRAEFWDLFERGLVDIDVDRETAAPDETVNGYITDKGRALIEAIPSEKRHSIVDELIIASMKATAPAEHSK